MLLPVLFLALLLVPAASAAQQVPARRLTARQVPAGVAFRGEVKAARQWRDRMGENLLLLTNTGEKVVWSNEYRGEVVEIEVHAYHYIRSGTGYRLLWHSRDFLRECDAMMDSHLDFAPGSLRITDVDADGIAETSFAYGNICSGGADGMGMKLILHEGATKYAIRGEADLQGHPPPMAMQIDPSFARVPVLRAYAVREWRRLARWEPFEGPP